MATYCLIKTYNMAKNKNEVLLNLVVKLYGIGALMYSSCNDAESKKLFKSIAPKVEEAIIDNLPPKIAEGVKQALKKV